MRQLKGSAPPIADFLYNRPTGNRRYSGIITARAAKGTLIEGLESPFIDAM